MAKNNKTSKTRIFKLYLARVLLFVFVLGLIRVPFTSATLFSDVEVSENNLFGATTLDLKLTSSSKEFETTAAKNKFYPGTMGSRVFTIENIGKLPFEYGMKFKKTSETNDLCSEFALEVHHLYTLDGEEVPVGVYTGPLKDFEIKFDESGDSLKHMYLEPESEQGYLFEVFLPIDVEDDFEDSECIFDVVAMSWQKDYEFGLGFWDKEKISNELKTYDWEEGLVCKEGQDIFLIGDIEDDKMDNPVDEFNWSGRFGVFPPPFADPFVVGTTVDSLFPWNSNYDQNYARSVDVQFFNPNEDSMVKLTISWSPGRSGKEQKRIILNKGTSDELVVGTTTEYSGVDAPGWWENMQLVKDEFTFELPHGVNTLTFDHLKGDGTLWDYIELKVDSCIEEVSSKLSCDSSKQSCVVDEFKSESTLEEIQSLVSPPVDPEEILETETISLEKELPHDFSENEEVATEAGEKIEQTIGQTDVGGVQND